jgi:hypothetical protein
LQYLYPAAVSPCISLWTIGFSPWLFILVFNDAACALLESPYPIKSRQIILSSGVQANLNGHVPFFRRWPVIALSLSMHTGGVAKITG